MIGRFRVATTSTGRRRQVYVHLYDDREEMAHRHAEARQIDYSPDTAGGVSIRGGWRRGVQGLVGDGADGELTVGDLTAEVTKGLHHLGHAVTF